METPVEYNAGTKKEERILITRLYDGKPVKAVNIELNKAVEIMAKADWQATVCAKNGHSVSEIPQAKWDEEWKKLRADYKKIYLMGALAAIETLLGYE